MMWKKKYEMVREKNYRNGEQEKAFTSAPVRTG